MLQEMTPAELNQLSGGKITVVVKNSFNTVANTNHDYVDVSAAISANTNNTVVVSIGSSATGGLVFV